MKPLDICKLCINFEGGLFNWCTISCAQRIWLDSYLGYLLAIQYNFFVSFGNGITQGIKSLILLRKTKSPIIWFCSLVLNMLWSRKNYINYIMTFNDINQFNVIDNQASRFFSKVLGRMTNPSQTYIHILHYFPWQIWNLHIFLH